MPDFHDNSLLRRGGFGIKDLSSIGLLRDRQSGRTFVLHHGINISVNLENFNADDPIGNGVIFIM